MNRRIFISGVVATFLATTSHAEIPVGRLREMVSAGLIPDGVVRDLLDSARHNSPRTVRIISGTIVLATEASMVERVCSFPEGVEYSALGWAAVRERKIWMLVREKITGRWLVILKDRDADTDDMLTMKEI